MTQAQTSSHQTLDTLIRRSAQTMREAAILVRELPKNSPESQATFKLLAETQDIFIKAVVDDSRARGDNLSDNQRLAGAKQRALNIIFNDQSTLELSPVATVKKESAKVTMPEGKTLTQLAARDAKVMNRVNEQLGRKDELVAMLAYAKVNKEVFSKGRSLDVVRAGIELRRPDNGDVDQVVNELRETLLANGRISYFAEVKGKSIEQIFTPPTTASTKDRIRVSAKS